MDAAATSEGNDRVSATQRSTTTTSATQPLCQKLLCRPRASRCHIRVPFDRLGGTSAGGRGAAALLLLERARRVVRRPRSPRALRTGVQGRTPSYAVPAMQRRAPLTPPWDRLGRGARGQLEGSPRGRPRGTTVLHGFLRLVAGEPRIAGRPSRRRRRPSRTRPARPRPSRSTRRCGRTRTPSSPSTRPSRRCPRRKPAANPSPATTRSGRQRPCRAGVRAGGLGAAEHVIACDIASQPKRPPMVHALRLLSSLSTLPAGRAEDHDGQERVPSHRRAAARHDATYARDAPLRPSDLRALRTLRSQDGTSHTSCRTICGKKTKLKQW